MMRFHSGLGWQEVVPVETAGEASGGEEEEEVQGETAEQASSWAGSFGHWSRRELAAQVLQ